MRLDKYISNCGYGSRKEAKDFIQKGCVSVNGKLVLESNADVNENSDIVLLNGDLVEYKKFYYFMLNKPGGVISATKDEVYNDKTVIDLLELRHQKLKLFPVGRLDKDTEGLVILTNNGIFAHNTLSPKKHVSKKYFAEVNGIVDNDDIAAFKNGVIIDGDYKCKPTNLEILSLDKINSKSEILLEISEGKFHQVKKMFIALSKEVKYLKRVEFCGIKLDEKLKPGEYRELNDSEMEIINLYI